MIKPSQKCGGFFYPHFSRSGGFCGKKYSKIMVRSIVKLWWLWSVVIGIILTLYALGPGDSLSIYNVGGLLVFVGVLKLSTVKRTK